MIILKIIKFKNKLILFKEIFDTFLVTEYNKGPYRSHLPEFCLINNNNKIKLKLRINIKKQQTKQNNNSKTNNYHHLGHIGNPPSPQCDHAAGLTHNRSEFDPQ